MACYVAKLCTGATILDICITVNTIKLYIKTVVNIFSNTKLKHVSLLVNTYGNGIDIIKDLMVETKRWQ